MRTAAYRILFAAGAVALFIGASVGPMAMVTTGHFVAGAAGLLLVTAGWVVKSGGPGNG